MQKIVTSTPILPIRKTIIVCFNLVFIASLLLCSCKKQQEATEQGQLKFNFSLSNLKSAVMASSDSTTASTLTSVVVSIEDMNGQVVKNSEKVELYNMNGSYISQPLSLPKGNYKVTRFLVLDWQNNVAYASPVKGSAKAYLVNYPLPLSFTIQTNNVTKIVPEVLNASDNKPEDFGYTTFSFSVAQTFDFLVGTFIYNDSIKNYQLTSSTISIYSNADSMYSGQLTGISNHSLVNVYDSLGVTNKITLPERYNSYTLTISKYGYKTYNQTFTKEELKLHLRSLDRGPLVVILEKTPLTLPILATNIVSDITQTTVTCGGNVTFDGGGIIIARGVCWSTNQTPTVNDSKTIDGLGIGSFTSLINGLAENTRYYVRAYAINNGGTGYGNTLSFNTLPSQATVTDIDGNTYNTVTIGSQVWMKENLKVTKYNDGTAIPNITNSSSWAALTSPGYCWYNNDEATYKNPYGALYNWYTVNSGKLCPTGWHIPTNDEWTTLITYLGGSFIAGGKLKESGTTHWISPNAGATDEYGFTALPGGYRNNFALFASIGFYTTWWSATEYDLNNARIMYIYYDVSQGSTGEVNKGHGFSVRCIKD